jgi:hypothetical protein
MKFSIEANLITRGFFGSIKEIGSGLFTSSLNFPTIYMLSGALLTRLIEENSITEKDIQLMIKNEKIKIYGAYIKFKGNEKYKDWYIPISYQLVDLINDKPLIKFQWEKVDWVSNDTMPIVTEKLSKNYLMGKKEAFYLMNFNTREVKCLNLKEERRTRVKIQQPQRIVEGGVLFVTSYKSFDELVFCIDIETEIEYKINDWTGNLGGEGSIAKFKIKADETPLLNEIEKHVKNDKYIAVSHIPIQLKDNNIVSPFGEVRTIIGNISAIGGWDFSDNKMKKIVATIDPGSFFSIKEKEKRIETRDWYLNLLMSALPIE